MISDACGEEVARRIVYTAGRSNYSKMQESFGTTTLGPDVDRCE